MLYCLRLCSLQSLKCKYKSDQFILFHAAETSWPTWTLLHVLYFAVIHLERNSVWRTDFKAVSPVFPLRAWHKARKVRLCENGEAFHTNISHYNILYNIIFHTISFWRTNQACCLKTWTHLSSFLLVYCPEVDIFTFYTVEFMAIHKF